MRKRPSGASRPSPLRCSSNDGSSLYFGIGLLLGRSHRFSALLVHTRAARLITRFHILSASREQDRRSRVLRTGTSLVVIGFAASISRAAAQYLPPQLPPVGNPPYNYPSRGYPPPAYYRANPSAPLQGIQQYPDGDNERYDDAYTDLSHSSAMHAGRPVASDRNRYPLLLSRHRITALRSRLCRRNISPSEA
jgi:hypothetical protein